MAGTRHFQANRFAIMNDKLQSCAQLLVYAACAEQFWMSNRPSAV